VAKSAAEKVSRGNQRVRSDAIEDKVADARKRNEERSRNAWKGDK
jgi:hypothetical protein